MCARKDQTSVFARVRLRPLAQCVAGLFLLTEGLAGAAVVTNCNDSGAGSLRSAVAHAASGDSIDMSGLTTSSPGCMESRVSLRTGEIKITQKSLTIEGPGSGFVVTGKYYGATDSIENARIFNHTGTGTLALQNFSIRFGHFTSANNASAFGGCIFSKGTVSLVEVNMSQCLAESSNYAAFGGAINAKSVHIVKSIIENNSAIGSVHADVIYPAGGYGGAVYVGEGSLYVKYSTISGNKTGGYRTDGGGFSGTAATAYIRNTTISNNTAAHGSAINLYTLDSDTYTELTVLNSTISNNSGGGAALEANVAKVSLYNSTVAFNDGYGVNVFPPGSAGGVILNSVILSNNLSATSAPSDFYAPSNVVVGGSHNLVFASTSRLPDDTIMGKCPLLAPIRNDGGATFTLMPGSGSPAIDVGNNVYNGSGVDVDQRGLGYPRSSGPPDIGAYEIQQGNVIFNAGFDGCP
jgi:hypothetical protein